MLVMKPKTPSLGSPSGSKVVVMYLDQKGDPITQDYPIFDMSTYRGVNSATSTKSTSLAKICELNNSFFASLSESQQFELYEYYVFAHAKLRGLDKTNYNDIIRDLVDRTEQVFLGIDIPTKLIAFVKILKVQYPPLNGKGSRVQDTPEKTFRPEDYVDVTAVSVMCKILCPILGEGIMTFKPPITDKDNKEFYTFLIFRAVLENPNSAFAPIYKKLSYYMSTTIKSEISRLGNNPNNGHTNPSFAMAKNGYCQERFVDVIISIIMTKKLVTFDIFKSDDTNKIPNIITYVYVVAAETTNSKLSMIQNGTNVMPRFDPSDNGSQEDNTTHLENTARISSISYDIPVMAEEAISIEVDRIIEAHKLPKELYTKMVAFYDRHVISPSPFNRAIIASLLREHIGGSSILLYLMSDYYTKLLVVAQILLLMRGYEDLMIYMSCGTPDLPRVEPITSTAQRIIHGHDKSKEYVMCTELFPGFSEKVTDGKTSSGRRTSDSEYISFSAQITRLMRWIIDYDHYVNIPPAVWSYLKRDVDDRPVSGALYEPKEDIMKNLCRFFYECHKPKEV